MPVSTPSYCMQGREVSTTLAVFLLAMVCAAGCITDTPRERSWEKMTVADLEEFVKDAAVFANQSGKASALAVFNQAGGRFTRGDLYVYAYDRNGTLLAHPYQRDLVGTNRLNWTDPRGLPVIHIGSHVAAQGGGYIAYLYPSPSESAMNESRRESYVPKIGYVCPAGDDWWIGSGIYFPDLEGVPEGSYPESVLKMVNLVKRGAAFGKERGREAAFAEISNVTGMFVDAEGHYLYAYDYNGTLLAHPHLPDLIGTRLIDRQDPFGMKNIRALADTARSGGGFIVFVWPNPARENRQELKIGYVLPANEEWWLGSGVYLCEITGIDTSFPPPSSR